MSNISSVTDDDFERKVLQSNIPALVDFWAEWCAPCKALTPVLEDIVSEYEGQLKFMKLNIDENSKSPQIYGVRGVPTLIIFKNGNAEATQVGALNKAQLLAFINQNI